MTNIWSARRKSVFFSGEMNLDCKMCRKGYNHGHSEENLSSYTETLLFERTQLHIMMYQDDEYKG